MHSPWVSIPIPSLPPPPDLPAAPPSPTHRLLWHCHSVVDRLSASADGSASHLQAVHSHLPLPALPPKTHHLQCHSNSTVDRLSTSADGGTSCLHGVCIPVPPSPSPCLTYPPALSTSPPSAVPQSLRSRQAEGRQRLCCGVFALSPRHSLHSLPPRPWAGTFGGM